MNAMRLFVLPVSTKRSLLYAQRFNAVGASNASLSDRLAHRASTMWASWEAKDSGWQKHLAAYGNKLLRHIPMEEWSLKSVPPLSSQLMKLESEAARRSVEPVEVVYPGAAISKEQVPVVLRKLATEREAMHRRRLIWCCIGMPIAVPFAVVPVIPNIPLFYLMYRAWSHWRAIAGGKHVRFLLDNNLLRLRDSSKLDKAYTSHKLLPSSSTGSTSASINDHAHKGPERLLLNDASVRRLTKALEIPEVHTELDRAVFQVQQSTRGENVVRVSSEKDSGSVDDVVKETNPADIDMDKESVMRHQKKALNETLYRDERKQRKIEQEDKSLTGKTGHAEDKPGAASAGEKGPAAGWKDSSVKDVVDETDPAQVPMDKDSVTQTQQDVLKDTLYRNEHRQTQIEENDDTWTNHSKQSAGEAVSRNEYRKDEKYWKKEKKFRKEEKKR
ncbi:hypothetical protein BROUX41_004986 [Berkeleyomyces rouxiae]|uniref:uncharacterized protein n=1 Tax=Berkeleyomyces rouxiae TaxID=2035830 RepID=UPI003B8294D6